MLLNCCFSYGSRKTKIRNEKVWRGLIGISMCQKRVHAFFYVKLFSSNAQENTHVTTTK